ncbi:hypothetical protein SLS63_009070 [Diaporthe eres]|uniref:Caspase domain-containing protein n=1 Tax=Diaporthe eres TaxID=83184 RepID=A0ABR1P0X1_DIAER
MTDVENPDAVPLPSVGASSRVRKGGQYLTGYDLGSYVRKMMHEKAVRVLVVLDSCFSGAGLRDEQEEPGVRGPAHSVDPSFLESDKQAEDEIDEMVEQFPSDFRDFNAKRRDWLLGENSPLTAAQSGCVVLTASAMNQRAREGLYGPGGIYQGALTAKMLIQLKRSEVTVLSYDRLHRQLVESLKTTQSPRIHGPVEYGFFSKSVVSDQQISHVKSAGGNFIELDVGRAQGVFAGATYYAIPFDYGTIQDRDMEVEASRGNIVIATVETSEELSSRAVLKKPFSKSLTHCVLRDWALKEKTQVHLRKFPKSVDIRRSLRNELEATHNLSILTDESENYATKFVVEIRGQNFVIMSYNLITGTEIPIKGIPIVRLDDRKAVEKVGMIIRHIARYWAIKALTPSLTSAPGQTNIPVGHVGILVRERQDEWHSEVQIHRDRDGVYNLVEGREYDLRLTYTGPLENVYISVFAANTSWAIEKLQPDDRGTQQVERHRPVAVPNEEWNLSTDIPDGHDAANDTLLVFVASHPGPSWDGIELGSLSNNFYRDDDDDLFEIPELASRLGDKKKAQRLANYNIAQGNKPISWAVIHYRFRVTRT